MTNKVLKTRTKAFLTNVLAFSDIEELEITSIKYYEKDFIKVKTPAYETKLTFVRNNGENEHLSLIVSKEDKALLNKVKFKKFVKKLSKKIIQAYNEVEMNSYFKGLYKIKIKEISLCERKNIFRVKFKSKGKKYIISFIIDIEDFFH